MYDNIIIPSNLFRDKKISLKNKEEFQTKSLHCLLNVYEIKENRTLMIIKEGYGRHEKKDKVYEQVFFTGEIKFYNENEKFSAWCVKGIIKEIVELPFV